MSTRGQGHCLTFIQIHSDLYFLTSSVANPLGPLKPNFMWSFHVMEEQKFKRSWSTKMATMPIYGKKHIKNLVWNQQAGDLWTWYTALGTRVLQSVFKWCSGRILTFLMAMSNLGRYAFIWENAQTVDFVETVEICLHGSREQKNYC